MPPPHRRVRLFPFRPEHLPLLKEQAERLAESAQLEVRSIARTSVLHETLVYLRGDDISSFVSGLQDCFPDAQVSALEDGPESPPQRSRRAAGGRAPRP